MRWKEYCTNHLYDCHRFIRFVIVQFFQDDCPYIASALAFTTLIAIVPLMSVSLSVLASFPVFQGLINPLQDFIFENFVPATGKLVQGYLQQFTSQVSKLSISGILFLLFTSLFMLYTIECTMNKIWRANSSRHGGAAFLLYWTILSLTPVILGLSIAASSYLFSLPMLFNDSSHYLLLHYTPFLLSLLGFLFLYTIVPNCPVKIRHALGGSIVAALLFEAAKQAFAYYLTRYNTYELLYGAFASVPIFFIWIYWVWLITLLGAEISYAFSVHHQRRNGQALDGFSHALLWLHELWLAQQLGKGLSTNELIETSGKPFAVGAHEMINSLTYHELIHSTADGHYMLSRDLDEVSLYSLSQLLPYRLPSHLELDNSHASLAKQWDIVFKNSHLELKKSMDISLEEFFKKKPMA
jgi:membrane protein